MYNLKVNLNKFNKIKSNTVMIFIRQILIQLIFIKIY